MWVCKAVGGVAINFDFVPCPLLCTENSPCWSCVYRRMVSSCESTKLKCSRLKSEPEN